MVRVTTNITIPRGIEIAGDLIWFTSPPYKWMTGAKITWNTTTVQDLRVLLTDLEIRISDKTMRVQKIDANFKTDSFNWRLDCEPDPLNHHCIVLKYKWRIFGEDVHLFFSQKLKKIIEGLNTD